ncbi:MAG: hypothetical protein ABFC55_07360 [Tenuifilaceae bacterium]
MRQVLIDYLSPNDRIDLAYKTVESQINRSNPYRPNNSQELLDLLESLNLNTDSLMITILSHGHTRGITFGTYDSLLTWCELCEKINSLRTNFPLILNLTAICNSYQIIPYKKVLGCKIDRIWISTNTVNSINKGLLAIQNNSFNDFIEQLDDSEIDLYKEII